MSTSGPGHDAHGNVDIDVKGNGDPTVSADGKADASAKLGAVSASAGASGKLDTRLHENGGYTSCPSSAGTYSKYCASRWSPARS